MSTDTTTNTHTCVNQKLQHYCKTKSSFYTLETTEMSSDDDVLERDKVFGEETFSQEEIFFLGNMQQCKGLQDVCKLVSHICKMFTNYISVEIYKAVELRGKQQLSLQKDAEGWATLTLQKSRCIWQGSFLLTHNLLTQLTQNLMREGMWSCKIFFF